MARRSEKNDPAGATRSAQDRFVDAWGQMGSAWGISRTVAEIHALLYITGRPLCTDDVMDRLQISRGNASMSMRALIDWGIVSKVHKRGERREYFEAESDVWTMFQTIVRERKKRELDPIIASIYEIRDMTRDTEPSNGSEEAEALRLHNKRLDAMLEFVSTIDAIGQAIVSPEGDGLRGAVAQLAEND